MSGYQGYWVIWTVILDNYCLAGMLFSYLFTCFAATRDGSKMHWSEVVMLFCTLWVFCRQGLRARVMVKLGLGRCAHDSRLPTYPDHHSLACFAFSGSGSRMPGP